MILRNTIIYIVPHMNAWFALLWAGALVEHTKAMFGNIIAFNNNSDDILNTVLDTVHVDSRPDEIRSWVMTDSLTEPCLAPRYSIAYTPCGYFSFHCCALCAVYIPTYLVVRLRLYSKSVLIKMKERQIARAKHVDYKQMNTRYHRLIQMQAKETSRLIHT